MSTTQQHTSFTGGIPAAYDRHLGPVIFEPYARELARRVPIHENVRLLEIACGTGIVTRRVLDHLPTSARLVATDLNQPMLDFAKSALPQDPRLEWRKADAQSLPFPDGSFDCAYMQFGIMFMPDKPKVLAEARRVLKAGGKLILSALDSHQKNPYGRIADHVLKSAFPEDPPTFYRVPFSDHDPDEHRRRAESAGFRDVTVESVAFESMAESAESFAKGLVRGNPVSIVIGERGGTSHERIEKLLAEALRRELGDRPVRNMLHAWVITGTA